MKTVIKKNKKSIHSKEFSSRLFDFLFRAPIVLYFIFSLVFFVTKDIGGDEGIFVNSINDIKENYLKTLMSGQICTPYTLLSLPFSFFFNELFSLRITNILLLIFYFRLNRKYFKASPNFLFYSLFYFATTGFFFLGTNDALFSLSLALFFIDSMESILFRKPIQFRLFLFLAIAIFTRYIFVLYLPIIFFIIVLLFRQNHLNFSGSIKNILIALIPFILLNIFSLTDKGKISYVNKEVQEHQGVTWAQRQYLTQLMVNQGALEKGQHVPWEKTLDYLSKNGQNSLPVNFIESVFFDLSLTFKEFVKDLVDTMIMSTRQLGLIPFILMMLIIFPIPFNEKIVPLGIFFMICLISFIIISNVELRWLQPVFLLSIWHYSIIENQKRLSNKILIINSSLMACLSIYGMIRLGQRVDFLSFLL